MGWFGPAEECGCCCTPPVVTCSFSNGIFSYTVENATQAEIREWCPSKDSEPPDNTQAIILTNRAASGTYTATTGCTVCIWAINECEEAWCCQTCPVPCCNGLGTDVQDNSLDQQNWVLGPTVDVPEGYYGRYWEASVCQGTNAITSVTLNGVEQFPSLSGWILVPVGTGPEYWDLVVTNDCGNVHTCRFWPPCCYRMSSRSYEIRGLSSEYYMKCESIPSNPNDPHITREFWVRGMDGLNGTHVDSIDHFISENFSTGQWCIGDGILTAISGELEFKETSGSTVFSWKVSGKWLISPFITGEGLFHNIYLQGETRTYTPFPGQPTITEDEGFRHPVAAHDYTGYGACQDVICNDTTGWCWWIIQPIILRSTSTVLRLPCHYTDTGIFGSYTFTCQSIIGSDATCNLGFFEVKETVFQ